MQRVDGSTDYRADVAAVKASVSLLDVARQYVPDLKKKGREYVGSSPFKAEATPSFFVDARKGVFKCFASGEGGDVFEFVRLVEGVDFKTALARLKELGGIASPEAVQQAAKRFEKTQARIDSQETQRKEKNIQRAQEIWRGAHAAQSTVVETYLRARGIDLYSLEKIYGWRVPPQLRFVALPFPRPATHHHGNQANTAPVGPVMVGCILDDKGDFCGVHRTYLTEDGTSKAPLPNAKLALGSVWGGLGWLYGPAIGESGDADTLVLGEGYETTLSVMASLARRGQKVYGASALTLGNLAGAGLGRGPEHPKINGRRLPSLKPDPERPGVVLPTSIKKLILLQDADGKDPLSTEHFMRRAVGKFSRAGVKVSVAVPEAGKDFNDMGDLGEVA